MDCKDPTIKKNASKVYQVLSSIDIKRDFVKEYLKDIKDGTKKKVQKAASSLCGILVNRGTLYFIMF